MRKKSLGIASRAQHIPYKFVDTRWTKSMGKPSTQNLKANYNHRRTAYVRR